MLAHGFTVDPLVELVRAGWRRRKPNVVAGLTEISCMPRTGFCYSGSSVSNRSRCD